MDTKRVWLLVAGLLLAAARPAAQEAPAIACTAFHPDGRLAAVSYRGGSEVLVFDMQTGLPRQRLHLEGAPIVFLAFDERRERLLGATPEALFLWRLSDFRQEARLELRIRPQGEEAPERAAYVYDPDRQLLYRSYGSDLYCYSLRRSGLAKTLPGSGEADRGALLAQAPAREALWVLDPQQEQLRRIELERFRETGRLDVPGALAFAVDNRRIAVLRRAPESGDYVLDLFDRQFERGASFPIAHPLPARFGMKLAFTGRRQLSIAAGRSVLDIDLIEGTLSHFDFDLPYDEVFFRGAGRLFLRRGPVLSELDAWGRVVIRHALWAGTRPLYDPVTARYFQLDGARLLDADGQLVLTLDPADRAFLAADIVNGVLALGTGDGRVALYELARKQRIRNLPALDGPVCRLALAAAHHRLVVGGAETGRLQLLNAVTGRRLQTLSAGNSSIRSLALDGEKVYLGDASGTLRMFRLADGRPEGAGRVLQDGPVTALAVHPTDNQLLVGGPTGALACALPALRVVRRFFGHDNAVRQLALSADGERLISVAGDGTVKLWNYGDGRLLANTTPVDYLPCQAFPMAEQEKLAVADAGGRWTVEPIRPADRRADWTAIAARPGAAPPLVRPVFSDEGQLLATAGGRHPTVRLWSAKAGTLLRQFLPVGGLKVRALTFLDRGRILLLLGENAFQYWDVRTGALRRSVSYRAAGLRLGGLCVDGRRWQLWAFQEHTDQLMTFDLRTGEVTSEFHVGELVGEGALSMLDMVLSRDGGTLALHTDRGIVVYDTRRAKPLSFVDHGGLAAADRLFLSPGGRMLAGIPAGTAEVVVYDLYQEKELFRAPGRAAVFLDAYRLVTARNGGASIDLWNYLNGTPMAAFDLESGLQVASLEYAPAMRRLLTTAADGAFLLWKEDDRGAEAAGRPKNRFEQALPLPARTDGAAFISFRIGAHLHFQFPIDAGPAPAEGAAMSAPWRRPSRQSLPE